MTEMRSRSDCTKCIFTALYARCMQCMQRGLATRKLSVRLPNV